MGACSYPFSTSVDLLVCIMKHSCCSKVVLVLALGVKTRRCRPAPTLPNCHTTSNHRLRLGSQVGVVKKERVSSAPDLYPMLSPTTQQPHQHRQRCDILWVWCTSAP